MEGLVHIHGPHCVFIGQPSGSLMRLETEYTGSGRSDDEWTESIFQTGSFLSSFKSFLPTLGATHSHASEIISMATHPWPTDIDYVWTLSRDRVLRLWKPRIGCVVAKTLSHGVGRESSPISGRSSPGKPQVLLDAERQTLLRVFSFTGDDDHFYILAFLPTLSSPMFGGSFQLLDTLSDQVNEVGVIQCSRHTAHCHLQDFMVIGNVLYTLWDRQGQSMVEKTMLDLSSVRNNGLSVWESALCAPETELTPANLEEVLMGKGSMADKYFDAVMRPNVFSTLTLRTAIDQYTDACLSLPGPPPNPLTVTYASLEENIAAVVGCTVNLNRDPSTGALQHDKYWNALKRDWEGFIARCREIERSARWPLVLGAQGQGDVIVVERERISALVAEDLPIHLHQVLSHDLRIADSQYDLFGILWTLRHKVGAQTMLSLESCLVDLMHQEIAFPFADILKDQADDAAFILEKLAGCFGPDNALGQEDRDALQNVLPSSQLFDSSYSFYLYMATLFKSNSLQHYEVHFTQLALSVAPSNTDTSFLWHTVVRGYIDLGLFEEAYAAWISTPSDTQKREHISRLVYRMCESNQVDKLLSLNFATYADEVEDALSFKARNADPLIRPSYPHILYSWFLSRGDYRNAASIMYQRARKLQGLMTREPSLVTRLAGEQLEAYMIAMNALSLADPKNLWFLLPGSADATNEHKSLITRNIPESRYSLGKHENEIIQLSDIQYEYTLLSAQIAVIPALPSLTEILPIPSSIILKLAQSNRFNMAMATARSLEVDMTDLFAHLTIQCLRLSHNPDVVVQEDTSDWLLTDNVSTWPGTPADKGWRYMRESLRRHDGIETDFKYSKITLETILTFQLSPPPWLIQVLEDYHHEYLIRVSLRFGNLEQAVDHTLSLIRKTESRLARETPRNAGSMWLPYTLIDQVLVSGIAQEPSPPRLSELRMEVTNRDLS
ncbi:Nuclear pore complex protein [Lentinula edodes]|uniref:Nuclear pore complex protein n=1 Tax=Lentinula edodes TaxID=5353 RepID=A0A1Q3EM18_LENED|nr:Nuclear pore complex protein [Lentinula edodes]